MSISKITQLPTKKPPTPPPAPQAREAKARPKEKAPVRSKTFLREWREAAGLTQEAAAEAADKERTTIGRIEAGQIPYSQDVLEALASRYGCEPADLIGRPPGGVAQTRNLEAIDLIRRAFPALARLSEPPSPSRVQLTIPVMGAVGAGPAPTWADDAKALELGEWVEVKLRALVVKGVSQKPRFEPGEILLYEQAPIDPGELRGELAVVDTADGRRLVKRLAQKRPGGGGATSFWDLKSENAAIERNVEILFAYRIVGKLPPRSDSADPDRQRPRRAAQQKKPRNEK